MSATANRNLRTGTPVWLARGVASLPFVELKESTRVDVAVVGAGVTGALMADAALQSGKSVVVVDRRGPAKGSTAASTALLQFELDVPLTLLSEKIGRERAVRAYWRSATAVHHLHGRIADLGLVCDFRQRQSLYLPGNLLDVAGLEREAAERQKAGLRSRFIDRAMVRSLSNINASGAILSGGTAEVDPVALVEGLWRSASDRGARLYSPVEVIDVDSRRDHAVLTTRAGLEIRAKHVVFATGYEPFKRLSMKGHRIVSTWAMATPRQPRHLWTSRALIWEASDPYHYMRTTSDGRIVIGGGDEDFSDDETRDSLIPSKIRGIQRHLKKLLPGANSEAEFAWTGCFGSSTTGLPSIGRVPGMPRCFAVLGYGGNGITFSAVAAQMFQRDLMGFKDPDQDLFAFKA